MIQSLPTMIVRFEADRTEAVQAQLDRLGNMGSDAYRDMSRNLASHPCGPFVHFFSVVVVPAIDEEKHANLVIELSADGHARDAIWRLAEAVPGELLALLRAAGKEPARDDELPRYLLRHHVEFGNSMYQVRAGTSFCGTPDMTVPRIRAEAELAQRVAGIVGILPASSARSKLERVRKLIYQSPDFKWALVAEPVANVYGPERGVSPLRLAWAVLRDYLAILVPLPVLCFVYLQPWGEGGLRDALVSAGVLLALEIAGFIGVVCTLVVLLRRSEKNDVPVDREPDHDRLAQVRDKEDLPGYSQNHMFGVSYMKPGIVRAVTMRLALWIVAELGAKVAKPGYIDKVGTIHFARWIRVPRTNRLVFLSNYDGSWQSYLEDFIARLREGLSTVWSNTRDFPKTAYLRQGGAADGSRFKRWARRQQYPTRLWYSAYPELSTERIRINARIRHGLSAATTEAEAADWLAQFGFAGRDCLQTREIPVLAFGGMKTLRHAHAFAIVLPDEVDARRWLASIEADISYGDRTPDPEAQVVAFTASGIRKLGFGDVLQTFPMAFTQGMVARAPALGDDVSAWDDGWKDVDALLVMYAKDAGGLSARVKSSRRALKAAGGKVVVDMRMQALKKPTSPTDPGYPVEAFGFKDGVSQPVMRGTLKASRRSESQHIVNPGELVLGYRDNLGVVPPAPMAMGHDIGRNGTYLVARQLEQDSVSFEKYLDVAAADLLARSHPDLPTTSADVREWIAAKMVGRWRDGTSLVRNPHRPGGAKSQPDNAFAFDEDPDGMRCPFGAHIRRANPRDSFEPGSALQTSISNRHRILRVGRGYRARAGSKAGLVFMCVNADIERQFEFLQQSWILGSRFHGLEDEVDPIVGDTGSMTVPTPQGPLRLPALQSFVRARGGGYFFMPSKAVLAMLSRGREVAFQPATDATAEAARALDDDPGDALAEVRRYRWDAPIRAPVRRKSGSGS